MFGFIKRAIDRYRFKKVYDEFVSSQDMDNLFDEIEIDELNQVKESELRDIYFVIFQVKDNDIEIMAENINKGIDIGQTNHGIFGEKLGSLVFIYFDTSEKSMPGFEDLTQQLVAELSSEIRVVYGKKNGIINNFGASGMYSYGPLLKDMGFYLSQLMDVKYGERRQVK